MANAWTAEHTASVISEPTASDDKYSRGVVGVRTGSDRFPGAAVLGVEAAWRAGAGMVRYLGPRRVQDAVLPLRPETVFAAGRVQSWVIGSGTDPSDRDAEEAAALGEILRGDVPVVVDAGALDLAVAMTASGIVTPHDREHERLRELLGLGPVGPDREGAAAETARALGAVIVLKGAHTVVSDGAAAWTVTAETSRLATAGTGDVLAATIAALAAQASDAALIEVAAAGAWLHSRAGALAVAARGGGPITALDVAEHLSPAIGGLPRA